MTGSSDCLFVVVVRDPYDWLRSFFGSPHVVHEDLLNRGFSHFLRSQWKLIDEYHPLDGSYKEIDNYNHGQISPSQMFLSYVSTKCKII